MFAGLESLPTELQRNFNLMRDLGHTVPWYVVKIKKLLSRVICSTGLPETDLQASYFTTNPLIHENSNSVILTK